jgi:spore maturation protein CgeB
MSEHPLPQHSAASAPVLLLTSERRFRILCVCESWRGSDARAAAMGFSRLGHTVLAIDELTYIPVQWRTWKGRIARRLIQNFAVSELRTGIIRTMKDFRPDCLFVFKGRWVHPEVLHAARAMGIKCVNFYPDVSFLSHGEYLPRTLPLYDHIFTTKSYGAADMKQLIDPARVTHVPPGFDPELHQPAALTAQEQREFAADAVFIGTWSPKKEETLAALKLRLPECHLRIWGNGWESSTTPGLAGAIVGHGAHGDEYAKIICGAKICLALLSEAGVGASSGDLITARTFQIPACGAFMLHERNAEVARYFDEGREAEFFANASELAQKTRYYLANADERIEIARRGRQRALGSGYSIDGRLQQVHEWLEAVYPAAREADA